MFSLKTKDDFSSAEEGFEGAVLEAVAALNLPITQRSELVEDILSSREENGGSDMECDNMENITPEGGRNGKQRKRRAQFCEGSSDEEDEAVS